MSNWQLTQGLKNLRDQVNAAFPNRDKASDGTIGDTAHQAETSGHNPDDTSGARPEWNGDPDSTPEVRAWDMDSDLRAAPATAQQLVDHLRALPGLSSVLRYMIFSRKIYRASNGWRPEEYTGASAHTEHIHFSGAQTQAADNNTSFDYRLEEIPVALTDADKSWLAGQLNALVDKVWDERIGNANYPARTARVALNDLSSARDAEVDPRVGMKAVAAGTPLARMVAAADAVPAILKDVVAVKTAVEKVVDRLASTNPAGQ
jgi:hypothetical protein